MNKEEIEDLKVKLTSSAKSWVSDAYKMAYYAEISPKESHYLLSLMSREITDEDIAKEMIVHFVGRNPHPKSKIYLEWEKKAFIAGAKCARKQLTGK